MLAFALAAATACASDATTGAAGLPTGAGPTARAAEDGPAAGDRAGTGEGDPGRGPAAHVAPAVDVRATADDSIEILDAFLAERMAGLAGRSPTWRAAMDTVRRSGFWVVLGRPSDLQEGVAALARYRVRHFGEVVPLRGESGRIVGVAVAIDVDRVRRLVEEAGLPTRVVGADVDRILIHEMYGHVVPLAQSRRLSGGCPDPAPGAPASSSCAIRRENRIRAELGLELRTAYDLTGLAIGRYLRGMGLDEALRAPDRH